MSTLRTSNLIHGSSAVSNVVLDTQGRASFGPDGPNGRAALYVNPQNNRVGVNNESPSTTLDVDGAINTTGNLTVGGTLNLTGALTSDVINAGSGTAVAPSVSVGTTDNGLYSPGTDQVAISTNGTERMQIDSSGRLLVGTSSSSVTTTQILQGNSGSSSGNGKIVFARGTTSPSNNAGLGEIAFSDSGHTSSATILALRDGGTWTSGSSQPSRLVFSTTADGASSPTERLRIDSSGNVGISISDPLTRLDLGAEQSDSTPSRTASKYQLAMQTSNTTSAISHNIGFYLTGNNHVVAAIDTVDDGGAGSTGLVFATSSNSSNDPTERMRIDSDGRVGIGTSSPDSFNTGAYTLVVGTDSNNAGITINNGAAGTKGSIFFAQGTGADNVGKIRYDHANNSMAFSTLTSERMRIDSSGRVGIGTTSPDAQLHIGQNAPHIDIGPDSGNRAKIGFKTRDIYIGTTSGTGATIFKNNVNSTDNPADSGTELMRIVSTGRVGIGTSSPGRQLQVQGDSDTQIRVVASAGGTAGIQFGDTADTNRGGINYDVSDNSLQFKGYNNSEAMRINSSGNLHIGRSDGTNTVRGFSFNVGATGYLGLTNTSSDSGARVLLLNRNSNGTRVQIEFRVANTAVGYVQSSPSSTAYLTSSDYRLKENIVPLICAFDRVKKLQAHRFNFTVDPEVTVDGFLAHEAQAVVPECASGTKDEVDDDGNAVMQGIDQSKLVPLLTAALQEAIAKIETLETKVAALEAG